MMNVARLGLLAGLLAVGAASARAQQPATPPAAGPQQDDAAKAPDSQQPSTPIPPLTDADRAAAFPNLEGHPTHDRKVYSYVLFDQLEWQGGGEENTISWDTMGWIGGDIHRLWFRTEGESGQSGVHEAEAHLLYGRAFSRWWDFVAGVRQDVRPDPAQTWAALGIQGLAPYFFELQATAYVGASGRTQARLEAEYEMLITNRLILHPRGEVNLFGKSDPQRGIGSGLSTAEAGLRLRYEFRREFAPYVGFAWNRKFGGTADFAKAIGEEPGRTRFTAGIRMWF
jgi:copper resistance protein B